MSKEWIVYTVIWQQVCCASENSPTTIKGSATELRILEVSFNAAGQSAVIIQALRVFASISTPSLSYFAYQNLNSAFCVRAGFKTQNVVLSASCTLTESSTLINFGFVV